MAKRQHVRSVSKEETKTLRVAVRRIAKETEGTCRGFCVVRIPNKLATVDIYSPYPDGASEEWVRQVACHLLETGYTILYFPDGLRKDAEFTLHPDSPEAKRPGKRRTRFSFGNLVIDLTKKSNAEQLSF